MPSNSRRDSSKLPRVADRSRPHGLLAAVTAAALAGTVAGAAAGETHRVEMRDTAFSPAEITVHVGDAVEWANRGIVRHTATAGDKAWEADVMPGRRKTVTLNRPGTVSYYCRYHPNMKGRITVEP